MYSVCCTSRTVVKKRAEMPCVGDQKSPTPRGVTLRADPNPAFRYQKRAWHFAQVATHDETSQW
jgi:hypothetical protein